MTLCHPTTSLLFVEGLSWSLKRSDEEKKITGCRIHVWAPAVTHLLFVDDSFLLCKATMEEVREIKAILQRYKLHSGQAIYFQKSGIYFSTNVRVDKQVEIKNILEVHTDLSKREVSRTTFTYRLVKKAGFWILEGKIME